MLFFYKDETLEGGHPMTLAMYIIIGVIIVAAIFFIIKGKK